MVSTSSHARPSGLVHSLPIKVAVGLGSGLGDRAAHLELALRQLAAHSGLQFLAASRWVWSPPLKGGQARSWFLNGVAVFEAVLHLEELLDVCCQLEDRAGRRRALHWGDRPLDLDLLVAQGVACATPRLNLPHPELSRRPFVLQPLLEVWPEAMNEQTGEPFACHKNVATGPRLVVGPMMPKNALRKKGQRSREDAARLDRKRGVL